MHAKSQAARSSIARPATGAIPAAPNTAATHTPQPPVITPGFRAQDQLFIPGPALALAKQDRYRLFASAIMPRIIQARPTLAKGYCQNDGRPPVDPALLLALTVLQFWECIPDRQAVELLRYHVGWCYAVGHEFGAAVFHPTTLVHFRQRLVAHEQSAVAFAAVLEGVESSHRLALVSKLGFEK